MADRRIIAVTGATGSQGGGVARAILADPAGEFEVRAITRDINSPEAKELAEQGAELVRADLDDQDSLDRAFEGAYGAFCVTFYWNHMDPDRETANGVSLARAANRAGIRHVVWSTLEDSRDFIPLSDDRMPTLMGRYKVPHFDAKAEADDEFRELDLPTTFLLTTYYWDNMTRPGAGPIRGDDGKLAITFPMGASKLAGIAAADIGKCALGILKRGDEFKRQTIGIAGELLTCAEMASQMTEVFGEEVRYNEVTPEMFRSFGFPGAEDMGNMFQFYRDFQDHFAATRDTNLARSLNPEMQDFRTWLQNNKNRFPFK